MLPFHLWKHLPWHLPFGQSNPLQLLYCLKHRHVWCHSQAHGMTNLVARHFRPVTLPFQHWGIFLNIFFGYNPSLDQLGRCLQLRVDIYQMEALAMANCLKKTFLSSMPPFHLWKHLPWHLLFWPIQSIAAVVLLVT